MTPQEVIKDFEAKQRKNPPYHFVTGDIESQWIINSLNSAFHTRNIALDSIGKYVKELEPENWDQAMRELEHEAQYLPPEIRRTFLNAVKDFY